MRKDFLHKPGRVIFLKALMAAALMVLAACMLETPQVQSNAGGELQLKVSTTGHAVIEAAGTAARTAVTGADGYGTAFINYVDSIGVTVVKDSSEIVRGNCQYDYNTSAYTPTGWGPRGAGNRVHYMGAGNYTYLVYYPFVYTTMNDKKTVTEIVDAFTIPADQSTPEKYAQADLLVWSGSASSPTLNAVLDHKLAMVEVVLPSGVPSGVSNVTVKATTTNSNAAITPWNISSTSSTKTYRCLVRAGTGVTLSGTYSQKGADNISWTKTGVNLTAGQCTTVNVSDGFHVVTFYSSPGSAGIKGTAVLPGQQAVQPPNPSYNNLTFSGWYKDGAPYNFATPVNGDITVYACWETAGVLTAGLIFYDKGNSDGGWRYLEAAPTDAGAAQWGPMTTLGGTISDIGSGKSNTDKMTGAFSGYASGLCTGLTTGGKNDWFLPSYDELRKMHEILYLNGNLGGFSYGQYWSSSETEATLAAAQGFSSPSSGNVGKITSNGVRAIRAF